MIHYILGCGFTINNLFENFPYKKLKITCNECDIISNSRHRDVLVKRIFRECYNLVLNDIIDRNVTFWLPLVGNKKANMHMIKFTGDAFKNLKKAGKWKDVDFLKSNFCGYGIGLFMLGKRTPRVKNVYVCTPLRKKITDNTNNGFPYGDGKIDTTLKDYLEKIYALFPAVSKADIKRILNYAWRSLYLHNSYGGDVLVGTGRYWSYIGNLKKNPLDHYFYYLKKLSVKIRVLYRKRKTEWDGYYYFALTDSQFQHYQDQIKKRGRPRKHFDFGTVFAYQILDECLVNEYYRKYIFRIPYISRLKAKVFYRHLVTDKAEFLMTVETRKFKDLVNINKKY